MVGMVSLIVLALAAVALVAFLIPAVWELRRTARSATETLDALRREIPPLAAHIQGALEDHRELTRRASREVVRVEELTERVKELADRWGRIAGWAAAIGHTGQIAAAARGVKKGLSVFLARLNRGG